MISFLLLIFNNNEFSKLSCDILKCFILISHSNNPKLNQLSSSGFLKYILNDFMTFNQEKQEKVLIILANLAFKSEINFIDHLLLNDLIKFLLNVLIFKERRNEIYEIVLTELNKLIVFYNDRFHNKIIMELFNLGIFDILDNFVSFQKSEELNNKAIMLKNQIRSLCKN